MDTKLRFNTFSDLKSKLGYARGRGYKNIQLNSSDFIEMATRYKPSKLRAQSILTFAKSLPSGVTFSKGLSSTVSGFEKAMGM